MSLYTDITTLLNDSGTFWTAQQVYDRANDAMLEVWPLTRHDLYCDTVVVPPGDESFLLPARMMIPQRLHARGRWYDVSSWWDVERVAADWRNWTPGEPAYFIPVGASDVVIAPVGSTGYFYRIEGVQYPQEEISGANLDIADPKPVKRAVAFYAAALCAAATRSDLAETWFAEARKQAGEVRRRMRQMRGTTVSLRARESRSRSVHRDSFIGPDPYA